MQSQAESCFHRQNPYLKSGIIFVGIISSIIIDFPAFILVFALTLLYLIFYPGIYLNWLTTILKLIPLFISYFVFGVLFRLSFEAQLLVFLRINFLLLLSVYLISTTSVDSLLLNSYSFSRNKFISELFFFLLATISFIPILLEQFNESFSKSKNFLQIITDTFSNSFQKIGVVEKRTFQKMNDQYQKQQFWNFPNLYAMLLLMIYVIPFSV
ncbi:MAG: hypothetical protein H8E57_04620 [Candidatus Cloacimonetes bacterium]|nr:hypothetical protein [Candidatus Cloacimonadota bacterium]